MVGNYISIAASILLIWLFVFKVNDLEGKIFGISTALMALSIGIGSILSMMDIFEYPMYLFGGITLLLSFRLAWKIRKNPDSKVGAYVWLIGMPCLAVFAVIMYFLIEWGII